MPLINPGIVAASPFLAGSIFHVTQFAEDVSNLGIVSATPSTRRCSGIVNCASKDDVKTLPEAVQAAAAITVISREEIRTVSPNNQADVVTWRGTDYRVERCRAYPQYGDGWYKVIAVSANMTNLMPDLGAEPADGE